MVSLSPISLDPKLTTQLSKTRCPHCGWPISARKDDRIKESYYEHLVAAHGAGALVQQ